MSQPDSFEEEASIFDQVDEEAETRAIEEAEAAIREGRVISHEAMVRWLKSWGTPDELPPPKCGE
jgi:predicted transcriptional regulator